MPTQGQATGTDPIATSNEQASMDIMYQPELENQPELERYLERKDRLEQNLTKAYALIFSTYCNKTMQNRIEEHPDYESMICDNPIELLDKIKVLLHDPIRAKYPFASPTEVMIRMLNIKQIENEGLFNKNTIENKDWYIWKAELYMQAEQQDEQEDNKSISDVASATTNRSTRV
jgi:hypothetical protein